MKKLSLLLLVLLSATVACKEPFSPEVDPENRELLVVEGHLTIGGIATFTLSRTADLQEREVRKPEANAKMLIEENGNIVAQSVSGPDGLCMLFTHDLEVSKNYRVKIIRANGKVYETDYLESKAAPEIDSVNYEVEGKGFKISLNTHDAANNTRFYSWNFDETWEIVSTSISYWELIGKEIVRRDPNINMTRCWQENRSSGILLGSTERLSEDRVSKFPLTFVEGNSIKLGYMYSILVKQYGLTRDAYQYIEAMKKNTEEIGTIFDPQPSELRGNIRCISDPKETVIGWVSAGTISDKRIFIKSSDKPASWQYDDYCGPVREMHTDTVRNYLKENLILFRDVWLVPPVPKPWKLGDTSYAVAPIRCADCRLRGSNVKPSYWPD